MRCVIGISLIVLALVSFVLMSTGVQGSGVTAGFLLLTPVVLYLLFSFTTIQLGMLGVMKQFGKAVGGTRGPGLSGRTRPRVGGPDRRPAASGEREAVRVPRAELLRHRQRDRSRYHDPRR